MTHGKNRAKFKNYGAEEVIARRLHKSKGGAEAGEGYLPDSAVEVLEGAADSFQDPAHFYPSTRRYRP